MGQIKPKDFNKFRTHEKITYFVFKRLKVIEGICDKKTDDVLHSNERSKRRTKWC